MLRTLLLSWIVSLMFLSGCAAHRSTGLGAWHEDLNPNEVGFGKKNDWSIIDLDRNLAQWPETGPSEIGNDIADFW